MPRPIICRRVRFMPGITHFKPAGTRLRALDEVILTMAEFEAIRLKDADNIDQKEAAKKMKISQPTFNRLLRTARNKVADALVNGKSIRIHGGNYKMVQPRRNQGFGAGQGMGRGQRGRMGGLARGPGGTCKCPSCGHEEPQIRGQPCMGKKCPKCGSNMIRR